MNKLVSVIIPCYNQAQYLPDALNSVLNQTYLYWECIIINDGSPDTTEDVAQKWLINDKRFKYFKKENGGLSSARNAGLNIAQGDYIQFLDADDIILPDKFTLQVQALGKNGERSLSISSYFSSTEWDLTQPYPSRFLNPRFLTDNYLHELIMDWEFRISIPVHCFLFRTSLFKNHQVKFNENLPNHEDWDCWMNIFKLSPEVKFIDSTLAVYRIRDDAMCNDYERMKKGFLMAINSQKDTFLPQSVEYKLLTRKYYLVKYGVDAENVFSVCWGLMKKMARRITRLSKKVFIENKN